MTKEEKRERRNLRHQLQAAVRANHFRQLKGLQFKFHATERQLRATSRTVADQLLAGKNPLEVVKLEERTP